MTKNKKIIYIVGAIILAIIIFFIGTKYGASNSSNGSNGAFQGANRTIRFANGGQTSVGQIINKDPQSITIQLNNGGSRIVLVSSSTIISKMAPAVNSDLVSGTNVIVTGIQNGDGSITAQNIQIRPMGESRPQ